MANFLTQTIMAATGHSKESDFVRYIKVTPDDHADLMEKEFEIK